VAGAAALSWRDVRAEAEARLDRTAEMLRQHALRTFGTQEAILSAAGRATAGLSWEELRASETAHRTLAELAAAGAPVVGGVLVADSANRAAVTSYEFPARPVDLSDRDYIRALRAGADRAVGEVVESRPMGWRVFPVARPAPPRPGDTGPPGSVISSFSPAPFEDFYAAVAETPGDTIAMLRTDGVVLARFPPVSLSDVTRLRPVIAPLMEMRQEPAPRVFISTSPLDGRRRLYAIREVHEWSVAVVYGLDMAALDSAWRHRMIAPLLGGLAATALLLSLTWTAARAARRMAEETESRAEAEARLAQAGHAASIGLLTAGLAHDVKNLVQAVRSGARLMERRADDPAEVRRCATLLADAAAGGGRLVDSMLAFARGGAAVDGAEPSFDVSGSLRDIVELLRRTLGSGYQVAGAVPPGLPHAVGERAAFEASIVNLAANARDAMPRGGTVTIAAREEERAEADEGAELGPGRYVVVSVHDTGEGMDAETLARVGEPFFTTKGAGSGNGLGLATVRGFCTRAGGALRLSSERGRGTTAELWLPVA
jgi:two-component system NtrC family sensor kinase